MRNEQVEPDDFDNGSVKPRSPEAWAMETALLILDDRGEAGAAHIAEMLARFRAGNNEAFIWTWELISAAFDKLATTSTTRN